METAQKQILTPTDLLTESLHNSEFLLAYAAEHGLDILKEHIRILTNAKFLYENKQWSTEIEIDFWEAYKAISRLIHPVSIDSLRAAQEIAIREPNWFQRLFKRNYTRTLTFRSVRTYTLFTILAMVLMLVIQIYFFVGTTRLNKIQNSNKRINEITFRLGELMLILNSDPQNQSASLEKVRLEDEQYELDQEKLSNILLLEPWLKLARNITFSHREKVKNNEDKKNMAAQLIDSRIEVVQEAQNYVLIIGLYILPLFFGLIGAFAFVLRELAQETKTLTFSKESNIKYTLRIQLGALAGLAIGLFWGDISKQQQFGFIESLSPLLLAFIAGYSVEYLFTGIERWLGSALKKKSEEKS